MHFVKLGKALVVNDAGYVHDLPLLTVFLVINLLGFLRPILRLYVHLFAGFEHLFPAVKNEDAALWLGHLDELCLTVDLRVEKGTRQIERDRVVASGLADGVSVLLLLGVQRSLTLGLTESIDARLTVRLPSRHRRQSTAGAEEASAGWRPALGLLLRLQVDINK